MTIITCDLCGKQEEHAARGLCERCYSKAKRLRMLDHFQRGRRAPEGLYPERRAYWRAWKQARRAA